MYIYLATLKTLNREFKLTNLSPLHFSIMQCLAFIFYFALTVFLFLNASEAQNESPTKTIVLISQARDNSPQCNRPSIQSHQTTNNGQLSISMLVFTSKSTLVYILYNYNFHLKLSIKFQSIYNFFFFLLSREKVMILKEKPYIILKGMGKSSTVIEWGDSGNSIESSTFKLYAPNFMARDITLKVRNSKSFILG